MALRDTTQNRFLVSWFSSEAVILSIEVELTRDRQIGGRETVIDQNSGREQKLEAVNLCKPLFSSIRSAVEIQSLD